MIIDKEKVGNKVTKKEVVKVAKKEGKNKTLSPMDKLEAVYESLKCKEATNFILLEDLLALLNDPDSTESEISSLFE